MLNVRSDALVFEGTLSYRVFPGPPNYEDVTKGDSPEPTYILKLDSPICAMGDETVDPTSPFDTVQVFPDGSAYADQIWNALRRLVGKRVFVEGKSAFGAHTGHHHAPLLLPITRVGIASDPTAAYGTPMTTVEGFYLALGAGNGDEASKFVIPQKRGSGPFSAAAMTRFYGNLVEPLSIIEISPVQPNEYRVVYTFVTIDKKRCNGVSLVRTVEINGANLIESIKALSGC